MLALIYGYRDYYKIVSLASPNNSSIEFLFENQLNIKKFIKSFMMMRVLNPLAIFKNLKLENSNIKIYIEDKILKENTRLYSLDKEIKFSNIVINVYCECIGFNSFPCCFCLFFAWIFNWKGSERNTAKIGRASCRERV